MSLQDDNLNKAFQQAPAKEPVKPDAVKPEAAATSAEIINVRDSKYQQRLRDEAHNYTENPAVATARLHKESETKAAPIVPEIAREKTEAPQPEQTNTPEAEQTNTPVLQPQPEKPVATWQDSARSGIAPFVVGGLSGAVMAVLAVFLINKLQPPMDPRMTPMVDQLGGFIDRMDLQEAGLQAVQVDLIKLIEDGEKTSTEVNQRDVQISKALAEVQLVRQELRAESGIGTPVFNVAAVQLDTAISRGLPFEAEWVTLFALTSEEPELRAQLQRLLPMARDGVETIGSLRQELKQISLDNGIPNNSNNLGLVHIGSMFLQDKLGIPIGNSPIEQVMGEMMRGLDNRLLVGDLKGALAQFEDLKNEYVETFALWLERARRRQIAGEVATTIRIAAEKGLRERVAISPVSAGNTTQ